MTIGIGLVATPTGLSVFVVNSIARDVPVNETRCGSFPFLAWEALRLTLLLPFPAISLELVDLFFG